MRCTFQSEALTFAIGKVHVLKHGMVELCQTEITGIKSTRDKFKSGKVLFGKITTVKRTVFVFAFCQIVQFFK
jgi:hypothetical protein